MDKLGFEIEANEEFAAHLENIRQAIQRLGDVVANMNIPSIAGLASPFYADRIEWMAQQETEEYLSSQYCQPLYELLDWDSLEIKWTLDAPERWAYESLVDWGKRLERAGIFDNYEIRWVYQKECVRAMLHSPIWYAGEAWYWLRHEAWEAVKGLWAEKDTDEA